MTDRISSLPNEVLYYILSLLSTKESVATSILSKRWKPLWRSVPVLSFNDKNYADRNYSRFIQSVCTFIISRDLYQPLQRFCLVLRSSSRTDTAIVNAWLSAAAQYKVEHLELCLNISTNLVPPVLSCKTLVVLILSLTRIEVNSHFFVDLPSLKILHFTCVGFSERRQLAEFLSGSPNLEDLKIFHVTFRHVPSHRYVAKVKFKRLPKLLRAEIVKNLVPLDVVDNVQFLHINYMRDHLEDIDDVIPEFHNLTHIEFGYLHYTNYGLDVSQILEHCPKVHNLSLEQKFLNFEPKRDLGEDWSCPPFIPKCISMHLTTCCLINYYGSTREFEFAKYIMQNAGVLRDITIHPCPYKDQQGLVDMIEELSFCTVLSSTCKVSFNLTNL